MPSFKRAVECDIVDYIELDVRETKDGIPVVIHDHNRGKEIYVWTVNEESSFNQVRNMNVDVVITDYPENAYNGIHKYDIDLLNKLSDTFENMDVVNDLGLNGVDYNGTGD